MNEKEQMLKDIGIVSFAVVDLALYLDTHPGDRNAMDYLSHYNKMRGQLLEDFSMKYYPLTLDMTDCTTKWKWGEAPLPWEGGCA